MRYNKKPRPQAALYRSLCRDLTVRGTAVQISRRYAELAVEAGKSGDQLLEQLYYNHAEHWRKEHP